jgi:hypothetical protein
MWRGITIAVIAFLLVDGYFWNSSLLNTGIRIFNQIMLAFGLSYS